MEGVLFGDGLDLRSTLTDGEDDAAVAWNLPAGDQEGAGGVVLLQEHDMRRHVRVDLREVDLVGELDDEHEPQLATRTGERDERERVTIAWRDADAAPTVNAATGKIVDFITAPLSVRQPAPRR